MFFLKRDGKTMNGAMEMVVVGVVGVLERIQEKKNDLVEFHHAGIKARVQQWVDEWKNVAAEQKENAHFLLGTAKCELSKVSLYCPAWVLRQDA
jgi:hypothetical protein